MQLSVLRTSFEAVAQVLLIAAVGAVAARRPKAAPLLSPECLRYVSRVSNDVFLPFLTAAVLGARVDAAALREDWVLVPVGLAATAFGYGVADLSARVFRPDADLAPALRVGIAHPNAFALPLLLLRFLCEKNIVNDEFDGDADVCTESAAAKLCVYLVSWHVVFWTYAFATLETTATSGAKGAAREAAKRAFLSPNMVAVYLGVAIGVSPLSSALFRGAGPLRPLGLAMETLGEPIVAVTVLVMAAALANGFCRRRDGKEEVPPIDRPFATATWFIFARCVACPALAYPFFQRVWAPGERGLSRLVILLELAMPGAQTVLVTLNAVGRGAAAEAVAPVYLAQYVFAAVSLTGFTAWALLIVYP